MKIALVTSSGGHLYQILQLTPCWKDKPHFWVTFCKADVVSLLKNEIVFYGYYPESRHVVNAIKNTFLALKILWQERPDVIISMGAGIFPPFLGVSKLFGIHTIYIEPIDFVCKPSLTGRLVYQFVDLFLVQNKKQLTFFPRAHHWGGVF